MVKQTLVRLAAFLATSILLMTPAHASSPTTQSAIENHFPCDISLTGSTLYNRAALLLGLRAAADTNRTYEELSKAGPAAELAAIYIKVEAGQPDYLKKMQLTEILINGLESTYNQSEQSRTKCITLASVISAAFLGSATIVGSAAGNKTLYGLVGAGLVPIISLDISGFPDAVALYRDSAEALRVMHSRYNDLFDAVPTQSTQASGKIDQLRSFCATQLGLLSGEITKRASTAAHTVSDLEFSTAKTTISQITTQCTNFSKSLAALDTYSFETGMMDDKIPALLARDALELDYALTRRERLSRPGPHDIIGLVISAPFKAITAALGGGTAYSNTSPSSLWADKDIALNLSKLNIIALPDDLAVDPSISTQIDALSKSLQGTISGGGKAKHDPKAAPVPPTASKTSCVDPDDATLACAVSKLQTSVKVFEDVAALENVVLRRARAQATSLEAANDLSLLTVRIGTIDPVALTAPTTGAAAGSVTARGSTKK